MSLYDLIKEWCEQHHMTIPDLAREAGIADNLLYQLRKPTARGRERTLHPDTAAKVAAAMKVHVSHLRPPTGTRLYGRAAARPAEPLALPAPPVIEPADEAVELLREIRDIQREILDIAKSNNGRLTDIDERLSGAAERRRRA